MDLKVYFLEAALPGKAGHAVDLLRRRIARRQKEAVFIRKAKRFVKHDLNLSAIFIPHITDINKTQIDPNGLLYRGWHGHGSGLLIKDIRAKPPRPPSFSLSSFPRLLCVLGVLAREKPCLFYITPPRQEDFLTRKRWQTSVSYCAWTPPSSGETA